MVAQGNGGFVPTDVEVGVESNGQTEIRGGLKAGQKVVVSGQFLIDSEASLKGTTMRMGDMPPPKDAMPDGPTHRGEGRVERIDKDKITLSHGPIPSLQWGPMTMGFNLPPNGLPGNIEVGDSVAFEIRDAGGGAYEITWIAPAPVSSTQTTKGNAKNGDVDAMKGLKK